MKAFYFFIVCLSLALLSGCGDSASSTPNTTFDNCSAELADSQLSDSVNTGNITFYFDQNYTVGQYVNGDWWVHNNAGNVIINRISPDSFNDAGRVRNGAQINPINSALQGFDGLGETGVDVDMPYLEQLNVDPTITGEPLVLPPGNSVVKAISRQLNEMRPLLDEAAILTIVSETPAQGSFRPPYVGSDKSLAINSCAMDLSILGNYPRLASTPDISNYLPLISGTWLDHNTEWTQRDIHPQSSMPTYGREIAKLTAEIALQLQLDYQDQEKQQLLLPYIQYAIDLYGILQIAPINNKTGYYWYNNGGHNQGRKIPLFVAALVLNHSSMLAMVNAQNGDNLLFQEDQQTFYVNQSDIDLTSNGYAQADLGLAEWAIRAWDERDSLDADWAARYRGVNGASTVASALSVRMMNAEEQWNWPAFFDYNDRYFSNSPDQLSGSLTGNDISQVVADLWLEYREQLGELYTRDLAQ